MLATLAGVVGAVLTAVLAPATALAVVATLTAATALFAVGYGYVRALAHVAGGSLRLRERLVHTGAPSDVLARVSVSLTGGTSDGEPAE